MVLQSPARGAHVPHKWGFGMAPLRPDHAKRADGAVELTSAYLRDPRQSRGRRDETAAAVSEVKGLFTRCWKNDQWDWFTVYIRLGSPTNRIARGCSAGLGDVARGLRHDDEATTTQGRLALEKWGAVRWLSSWTDGPRPLDPGWGFIYVLSTRENPGMLKIGFTTRPVEDRVAEINRATGVVVPFGARRAWRVRDARSAETLVHSALQDFRVRADREFFLLDYRDALTIIEDVIGQHRLEG